ALRLWMDLLDAGVNIVQLNPETIFRHEKSEMIDIIRAIIELSRGHSESARKAERNGAARQAQPSRARQEGLGLTRTLPACGQAKDGKLCLIPERAAAVQRIYELAAGGYGVTATVRKLTEEGVPPFGERQVVPGKEVKVRGQKRPKYQAAEGTRYGSGVWVR